MAPTPVFLPGESQGRGSLVGWRLWGRTESDTTDATQQPQQPLTMTMGLSTTFGLSDLFYVFRVSVMRCIVVVQPLRRVQLFATPWTAACQASLSITNSWSLPKLMSIKSVMPSNCLILCRPLLLLPSVFPSIRVFSKESVLLTPKY